MANTSDVLRRLALSMLEAWRHIDGAVLTKRNFYRIPNYLMLRTVPAASPPPARIALDRSGDCYTAAEKAIKDAAGHKDKDIDVRSGHTAQALFCIGCSTNALRDEELPEPLGKELQDLKFFHSFKGDPFHYLGILTHQFHSDRYRRKYSKAVLKSTAILQKEVVTSLYVAIASLTAWPSDRPLVPGKVFATVLSAVGPYARVLHTHLGGDIPLITCSPRYKISTPDAAEKVMDYAFQHKMPSLSAREFWAAERKEQYRESLEKHNVGTGSQSDDAADMEYQTLEPID